MQLSVRVPATAANLGPGFDCLGLALDLCNEVILDPDGPGGIRWEGEGADELPTDGSDMVSRAFSFAAERGATHPRTFAGGLGRNAVPIERGLGSSSAAAVAGITLAIAAAGDEPDRDTVFELAAEFEGHPDNAAAAVYGGVTIAAGDGPAVRLDPDPALRPVVLVPEAIRLPTDRARSALPDRVSRADAVSNLQHTALAVVALTRDPGLLGRALQDRLHQQARLDLVPAVRAVFERIRDAGIPVCVSGAGPSLLAFRSDGVSVPNPGAGWRILEVGTRARGFTLDRS